MRAPNFWDERSIVSNLLAPAGAIVSSIAWIRSQTARSQQIKVPVICVALRTTKRQQHIRRIRWEAADGSGMFRWK